MQPGSASEQKKCLPPLLTWQRDHNSDLHTCLHQQRRITLMTTFAEIFEISRENVLSKSGRLSGLECLFRQSKGDGVILNLFCAKKKPEDYFLSSVS